jgi:hypothetical protein
MPIQVHILAPVLDEDVDYRGTQYDDREVKVRVLVENAANLGKVGVKAGTGQSVEGTVFSDTLKRESNTSPFWSGWVDLNYAVYFVRVVAFEPKDNPTDDDYDHSLQPLTDPGT